MTRGVGVFRRLDRELSNDGRSVDLHGDRLWLSVCGAAVLPHAEVAARQPPCPDCRPPANRWFA